jgi:prepilin-type N-terminal cleavage/methylation domain-containing protein
MGRFEDKNVSQNNITIKSLSRSRKTQQIQGTTLAEVLVAIVIVGVLGAIAAPNVFSMGSKPLPDTVSQIAGVLRSARSKAIAQTSPIKVRPLGNILNSTGQSTGSGSNTQLEILRATSTNAACNSETGWTSDETFSSDYLTLGKGITSQTTMVDNVVTRADAAAFPGPNSTSWQVCFNTRGVASTTSTSTTNFQGNNIILTLQQASDGKTQRVEIFPGGGIQIYDN